MRRICLLVLSLPLALALALAQPVARADDYTFDNVHSSVTFKIEHMGIGFVHGRFNTNAGQFSFDHADPTKAKFVVTITTDSIDTNVKARDDHLRTADFFDVKKYPEAKFASTTVKVVKGGWEVTGDFTMHGVTKPVTFVLHGGKIAPDKKGARIGFWTEFTLRRSDFGMTTMLGLVGDDVFVAMSFEGVVKK